MKKLQYIFILFTVLLASCDPMEDIYDKVDKEQPLLNVQQLEYTLIEDDYDSMGKEKDQPGQYDNFSSSTPPADFLPDFLASKYPTFNEESVVKVSYDYYRGGLDYLYALTNVVFYELSTSDYDSFGGDAAKYNNFSSSAKPEDHLPAFLLAKYSSASTGDLVLVTYKYYNSGVNTINEYYEFDGSVWASSANGVEIPEGVEVYTLSADDYDSMGAPGKYDNFSSSAEPENYLPQFLSKTFTYAQDGDKIAVVYKYYSGSTETEAKEYTKTGDKWMEYKSTIVKTDQYILVKSGWIFDPTVLYTIKTEDFQAIVDYTKTTHGDTYVDKYGTSESYYGAGAYYSNFDLREDKRNTDEFATWEEAVSAGIQDAFLPIKFPNAVTQVEGVDVFYVITFATYDGSNINYSMKFQCIKSAPSPEFEYVEDSKIEK